MKIVNSTTIIDAGVTPTTLTMHDLASDLMAFLRPLVDLKDWGLKKSPSKRALKKDSSALACPKPNLPHGMLSRWLNGHSVPDRLRVELSVDLVAKHLARENDYYYRASATGDRVLLSIDLDCHAGQTDCAALAEWVKAHYFPGTYFEPSNRGYHGFFILDLREFLQQHQRSNLKSILKNLWSCMETGRKAEGFTSDVDKIKGTSNTPHCINGRWVFQSGDRGGFAKLPVLPDGAVSLLALKNTAVFTVDDLRRMIERHTPTARVSVGTFGPSTITKANVNEPVQKTGLVGSSSTTPTLVRPTRIADAFQPSVDREALSETEGTLHEGRVVSEKSGDEGGSFNRGRVNTLINSSLSLPIDTIPPPSLTSIESVVATDPPALEAYRKAYELHGDDPLGRMHDAYFIALRVQSSALGSPESLRDFYSALGFKGTAPEEATLERARLVLEKRKTRPIVKQIFNKTDWLPLIEQLVTKDLIKDARNWAPCYTKRSIGLDSLAAVLCVMSHNIMHPPVNRRLLFSVADAQIAGFLKKCHERDLISSGLPKLEKRSASVKVLQLAGLIVLRDGRWTRPQFTPQGEYVPGIAKRYGFGWNHPQHATYVKLCEKLGEDPHKVDPACLSLSAYGLSASVTTSQKE